jgi:multiple sugar transport system substrate-binding protein
MKTARIALCVVVVLAISFPTLASCATEITYWDFVKPGDGSPRGNILAKNLERFHAKYPDIRVRVETIAPPLILSNLVQAAAAGTTPDVIRIYNYQVAMHLGAETIQPIDRFAQTIDKTDWLVPWDSNLFAGKKYVLPFEYRFSALLYRKDILEKAGARVPTTYDEMCTAAGKINSPKVMGFAIGLSQSDQANTALEWMENTVAAAGGQLFDETGKAIFNNAAGLKVYQVLADLMGNCKASGPAMTEFTSNSIDDGLKAGTIAMASQQTARILKIRSEGAGDNLQWAPPPGFEKGKPAPVHLLGFNLGMGKYSKAPDAAWKFIEFMTTPETQVLMAQGGELPSRKSPYQDPWFKRSESKFMVELSDHASKNGRVGRYPRGWLRFGQIMVEEVQSIVLKGVAPTTALANTVEKYNRGLSQD